ncbi:MAG TPA: hypothetical protein PLE45_09050 [Spirochaetota bacterium]|nr:hypothetical protein [Spirochaetota bacterium]HOL57210.1 hypothetical protein [Spirochaetota bacterium]HPP03561.1 hypothetical protein [Spirochaetota bacterium]
MEIKEVNLKIVYLILIIFLINFNLFSILEVNDYYDINLIEKSGIFRYETFQRYNSSTTIGLLSTDYFHEFAGRMVLTIMPPELYGFMIKSEAIFSRSTKREYGGEFEKTNGLILYYGEAYLGFRNKYFTAKLGFQNLVSSDAIYNHLLLDDYSGPFFALKLSFIITRFVDVDLIYNFIRPHQGEWSSNLTTIYEKSSLYGKSLFIRKVNIRPLPWIRLGFSDSVYFLGENMNIWFLNPFSVYFVTLALEKFFVEKYGSALNTGSSDLKVGFDFNIGFKGWRVYGELMVDDSEAFFLMFRYPIFPNRVGFVIGGELRGYLFSNYIKLPKYFNFIFGNMYINMEYGVVSKYTYSRDDNNNYEYVRQEYQNKYYTTAPVSQEELNRIQRVGNFIGFMYGSNSDCFDIAIGWRNDLVDVRGYAAEYQGDIYFDSFKNKKIVDRLFKFQIHYRHYRLGDERNILTPFYMNEHYYFDLDQDLDSDGDGNKTNDHSNRETEFLRIILEEGNQLDFHIYSDIIRISRFIIGIESKFNFIWTTFHPYTWKEETNFTFRWEIGLSIIW